MTRFKIFIFSTIALVSCSKDSIEHPTPSSITTTSDVSNLLTSGHWKLRESYFLESSNGSTTSTTVDYNERIRFNTDQTYNRVFSHTYCADSLVGYNGTYTLQSDETQLAYIFGTETHTHDILRLTADSLILKLDISSEMQNVAVFIKETQKADWPRERLSM